MIELINRYIANSDGQISVRKKIPNKERDMGGTCDAVLKLEVYGLNVCFKIATQIEKYRCVYAYLYFLTLWPEEN